MLRARLIAGVPGRPDRLAHRPHRGPLPRLRARALRGRPRRAAAAQEGEARRERRQPRRVERLAPQHRHLRQQGRAGRRRERRRHQEDRQEQEARPLRRAPGRLRQPLHLRAPRLGLAASTRCPKADADPVARPQRPGARRATRRPEADRARLGRPPARLVRHRQGRRPAAATCRPPRPRPRCRSSSACSRIPTWPGSREAGGLEQLLDSEARRNGKFETFKAYFSRPFGLDPRRSRLRPLRKGSHVIGGTILGRVGSTVPGKAAAPRLRDPPGRPRRAEHRPEADPRRLEAARGHRDLPRLRPQRALRRRRRRHVDRPDPAAAEAAAREARALRPAHRHLPGRPRRHPLRPDRPPRAGDARVPGRVRPAARPSAASSPATASTPRSGNVSEHSSGNAVDISTINGIPILGHQEPGGITEQTVQPPDAAAGHDVRRTRSSRCSTSAANTLALADHADHIHVGFHPLFGDNKKLGKQALAVLKPGQWSDLISRLGEIENPVVPTKPSKYALPAQPEALQPGPRRRVGPRAPKARSASSSSSSASSSGRPTAATWCRPVRRRAGGERAGAEDARRARAAASLARRRPRRGAWSRPSRRPCPRPARRSSGRRPSRAPRRRRGWLARRRPRRRSSTARRRACSTARSTPIVSRPPTRT